MDDNSLKFQEMMKAFPFLGEKFDKVFNQSNLEESKYSPPYIFLCFLEMAAYVSAFQGSKLIDVDRTEIPLPLYTMSFLPSQERKNRGFELAKDIIFRGYIDRFEAEVEKFIVDEERSIEESARKKFNLSDPNNYSAYNHAENYKAKAKDRLRKPEVMSTNSTYEGVASDSKIFMKMGHGVHMIINNEVIGYYKETNSTRTMLDTLTLEMYEHGIAYPKSTSSKNAIGIIKNPLGIHSHGTIEGEGLPPSLLSYLAQGAMRRFIIFYKPEKAERYNPSLELNQLDLESFIEAESKNLLKVENFENFSYEVKEAFEDKFSISITPRIKALALALEKNYFSKKYPSNLNGYKNARDIPYKAFRITAILMPLCEGINKTELNEQLYLHVVKLLEFYTSTALSLFENSQDDEKYEIMFKFMLQERKVSRGKFRKKIGAYEKKNPRNEAYFVEVFEKYCNEKGYILTLNKTKTAEFYIMDPLLIENIEADGGNDLDSITVSASDNLNETDQEFVPVTLKWEDFQTLTGTDLKWSATTFKNDRRKNENSSGELQVIGLDIDNGITLKEGIEFFKEKGFKTLISTTRNHQKSKKAGEEPKDRFRIVIPLKNKVKTTPEDYVRVITNIYNELGLPFDTKTQDISRFWFGTNSAQHTYIEGEPLNWEDYDYAPKKENEGRIYIPKTYTLSEKNPSKFLEWAAQNYEKYGGRNNTLFRIARKLEDDGYSQNEIREYILELASMFNPPMEAREVEQTVFKSRKL